MKGFFYYFRFFCYIRIELEILGKNQLFRLQEQQTEPDTKATECEDQRQSSFEAMTAVTPSALHPTGGELPQGSALCPQGMAQLGLQLSSHPDPG